MNKIKILVIDDEADFLRLVKLNLENTGLYDVLTLANAQDVLSEVHAFEPDVILLDLMMRTIGGLEVCEMLNNDSAASGIPIIVLSALAKDVDKLQAYKRGVVDYLVKPATTQEIIAVIEKALKNKMGFE